MRLVNAAAAIAVLAVSGCAASVGEPLTSAGGTPSAASKPTPRPAAPDTGHRHCRPQVENGRLAAPFWLDTDHFNPADDRATHTAGQALRAYRTDPATRHLGHRAVQVAFAKYSRADLPSHATSVWIIVADGVEAESSLSSTSIKTDETAIFRDRDMRSLAVVVGSATRCR